MSAEAPVALVTGASRGFGRAVGEALGARGWRVVGAARTVGGLEELDDAIRAAGGPRALLVPLDLADPAAIDQLGAALFERYGALDLLVHCAAQGAPLTPVAHLDPRLLDQVFAVTAFAAQRLIRALDLPLRQATAGQAVFIDDPAPAEARYWGVYGAAKSAQAAFARAYAAETPGVDVRLFAPNPMATALRAKTHPGEDKTQLADRAAEADRLLAALSIESKMRA